MSKFVINTKQGLYEPLEIEIDGKTYKVKDRFTKAFLRKLAEKDTLITDGSTDAPFERLEMLIGKQPIIEKLDIRDVISISEFIIKHIFTPEKVQTEKEKNVQGPGDKT